MSGFCTVLSAFFDNLTKKPQNVTIMSVTIREWHFLFFIIHLQVLRYAGAELIDPNSTIH